MYSDSSYVQIYYKVARKSDSRQYHRYVPEISTGKYTKKGEFYIFKGIGGDSIFTNHFKLNGNRLVYYFGKGGKLKKGAIFKKVKSPKLPPKEVIREISDYLYYRSIDKELEAQTHSTELRYGDYISGKFNQNITEFIYPDTKELILVKISGGDYPEYTDNYYYKKGSLVYIETWVKTAEIDTLRIKLFIKNGKAINKTKINKGRVQEIIAGGKRYMTDYLSRLSSRKTNE